LHAAERGSVRLQEEHETVAGALETCRARHREHLQHLGNALRKALASGKGDTDKVAALRAEIAYYNTLLRAESADDIGGPADLPLDAYPAALDALGLPWHARPVHRTARLMAYLSPSDRRILAVLPLCVLVAVLGVLYLTRWRGDVRFDFAPGADGSVSVTCANDTASPIVFYAPWPGDAPSRELGRSYGLHLYLQEAEDGDYRLFPSFGHGWYHQGVSTSTVEPIPIAPGLSTEVIFRPEELALTQPPTGLRVVATGKGGGEKASYDWSFKD
jgi:hypothetical protein